MIRIDDKRVIYERGEEGFNAAWKALEQAGKNLTEWMYMNTELSEGQRNHCFKNSLTREYFYAVDYHTGGK